MKNNLLSYYCTLTLHHPYLTLALVGLCVLALAAFLPRFNIDASAESLVRAEGQAIEDYRAIRARYGSDDYLIVAYKPNGDLFARAELACSRVLL